MLQKIILHKKYFKNCIIFPNLKYDKDKRTLDSNKPHTYKYFIFYFSKKNKSNLKLFTLPKLGTGKIFGKTIDRTR